MRTPSKVAFLRNEQTTDLVERVDDCLDKENLLVLPNFSESRKQDS